MLIDRKKKLSTCYKCKNKFFICFYIDLLNYYIDLSINWITENEYDFNISILVSRYTSCEYELMKTIEVKGGQHIKVNVTNDDNPLACLKTEKNSVCYYETLQGIAEGRALISERNETIFYHPENYTIIFFKNMTANSSIFQN